MQTIIRHKRFIVHPYKFNLWIAIVAMVMMFAAFTSAYIVKQNDINNWVPIQLPNTFNYSTIIIILSSIFMQCAYYTFKKNYITFYRIAILLTFLSGALFLIFQIIGWKNLIDSGILLSTNVSGSFIYVISGAHFVHVFGGVIALLIFSIKSFNKYKSQADTILLNIHPEKQVGVELMATYWHFVDLLWIYLFIFFQMS